MSLRRSARIVLVAASALAAVTYPFTVYYGLSQWGPRRGAPVVLGTIALLAVANLKGGTLVELWRVLRLPLALLALVLVGALVENPRFMMAMPVLVNLVFLHAFGGSLRGSTPLVERFARLQEDELSAEEVAYCRGVTWVWTVYFAANIVVCGVMALWAPLSWWTLYAGLLAYVIMGTIFTVEYLVRKFRFRRFSAGLHDRILERVLPAPRAGGTR
jgi:uncharacterized membrane protein